MRYVEPFLFFFSLAVYIYYPLFQQIVFKVVCEREFSSNASDCLTNKTLNQRVQERSSEWLLYYNVMSTLPSIITPVLFSMYGSRYGSNYLLLFPIMGEIIGYAVAIAFDAWKMISPMTAIVLSSLVNILGSYGVARALASNYLSAITSEAEREKRFLYVEIISFFSFTISGFLGGYIIEYFSLRAGLVLCNVLICISCMMLYFVERVEFESPDTRSRFNLIRRLKGIPPRERTIIIILLAAEFFEFFAEYGAAEIIVIYSMRSSFQFTPVSIGWLLSTTHAVKAVGSLLFYPILTKFFSVKGWVYSLINQILMTGYFIMLCLSTTKVHLLCASLFFFLEGGVSALISTALSKTCRGSTLGAIFGAQTTLTDIGALLGSITSNALYMSTLYIYPGLTYCVLGAIIFLGGSLATIGLYMGSKTQITNPVITEEFQVMLPSSTS